MSKSSEGVLKQESCCVNSKNPLSLGRGVGQVTLCKALNCLQGSYYIELAERREKDKEFVYGWLKNRVSL